VPGHRGEDEAQGEVTTDPLRDELLDAAARVFAREGYDGTKILDIVGEAGVSTGAVYGRFGSKNELLQEAVVRRAASVVTLELSGAETVVQLLLGFGPLTDDEAVRLEALVAARREPEVAEAILEADRVRTEKLRPLFEAATLEGTIDPALDPATVLFLVRTIYLGLLLERAAGSEPPAPEAWEALVRRVSAAIAGRPVATTRPD
jgi:AcrR family transcriptional regulator